MQRIANDCYKNAYIVHPLIIAYQALLGHTDGHVAKTLRSCLPFLQVTTWYGSL